MASESCAIVPHGSMTDKSDKLNRILIIYLRFQIGMIANALFWVKDTNK